MRSAGAQTLNTDLSCGGADDEGERSDLDARGHQLRLSTLLHRHGNKQNFSNSQSLALPLNDNRVLHAINYACASMQCIVRVLFKVQRVITVSWPIIGNSCAVRNKLSEINSCTVRVVPHADYRGGVGIEGASR